MNYLAHAYLSFDHEEIMIGNMVSDFIKGARQYDYPPFIQHGIRLHRDIDRFTDLHPATAEGKKIFKADYGLYSGAILDVVYDHFLANDAGIFSEESLQNFATGIYDQLEKRAEHLPEKFQFMLPYMRKQNWLFSYRLPEGISRSMQGLVRRAAYLHEHETAFRLFMEHYESLRVCYETFFPDVKEFAKQRMTQLI